MSEIKGKFFLLLAFSLAGTSVVTARMLAEKLNSFTITAVSLGLLLLCLLPVYANKTAKTIRLLKITDWRMLLLQALFGIFLFRIFLLFGVHLTSTVEAGILTGAAPAITALLAWTFLKEPLSGKTILGIACTIAGIALLQGLNLQGVGFSRDHFWGNALILCAAASESTFNVIARKQGAKGCSTRLPMQPMVQMLLVSAIAFVFCLFPALFEQPLPSIQAIGREEWAALVWYGLVVTALAFIFYYAGVQRCDAYTIAAFSGMMPLTSMLLSVSLFSERIGYVQWAGGILIISSMLLIGESQKPQEAKKCSLGLSRKNNKIF
ncbi:EamA family transporter|uniref:Permease of the drug/metabolite transporter (DMT) superfamily n=1 Tax=Dendrosporobacter quercicolus TaxID=146817 RepID=A0A1G9LRZ6_9FIRM|nr:DMT family transporter [Dendrosporobacter quercicolus]NSL46810.1 EamA family transporter [Dendrosporobacter quercicolus DSM 1736]SDL64726.1 Permease of the drug/metabolite transporter (DMT) superfamily [Dendrosporobacter quercicolus]